MKFIWDDNSFQFFPTQNLRVTGCVECFRKCIGIHEPKASVTRRDRKSYDWIMMVQQNGNWAVIQFYNNLREIRYGNFPSRTTRLDSPTKKAGSIMAMSAKNPEIASWQWRVIDMPEPSYALS